MHKPQRADSPIPPALLRSPRTVRRKPGTFGLLLVGRIFTVPVLAFVAALLAFVVLEPIIVFLLPAQPARVVGQWRQSKAHQGTVCYIQYQFDRSGFTGIDEVRPEEYQALVVGQAVQAHVIRLGALGYSALDRSLLAYARNRSILWFGAIFALAIGGICFYSFWFLPWRVHWLTQHGNATFGAIVKKSRVFHSRRHVHYTLTYQFKAFGSIRSRRIRISPQRFDSAGVKDLVVILFDPKRPSRSIVYDYCDFIAS